MRGYLPNRVLEPVFANQTGQLVNQRHDGKSCLLERCCHVADDRRIAECDSSTPFVESVGKRVQFGAIAWRHELVYLRLGRELVAQRPLAAQNSLDFPSERLQR